MNSYRLEALEALRAQKRVDREREQAEFKAEAERKEQKQKASDKRIAAKMARIEGREPPPEPKVTVPPKKAAVKKAAPKKAPARKKATKKKS